MGKNTSGSSQHTKWFYPLIPASFYIRLRAIRTRMKSMRRGERELNIMDKLIPAKRVAVDVGANRGVFTYYMSKCASRVVAYEANPVLANFVRKAGLKNVEVREKAVADQSGTMTFSIPLDPDGSQRINCGQIGDIDSDAEKFEVESVRLDDENLGDVGFIKADVEGHEKEVILGAKGVIEKYKPVFLLEILSMKNDEPEMDVVHLMEELGYSCYYFNGTAILPLERAKVEGVGRNFLFFPDGMEVPLAG